MRRQFGFPLSLKTAYGTATSGVWRIGSPEQLQAAIKQLRARGWLDESEELLLQEPGIGSLERVQSVFDRGTLVAWHGYRQEEDVGQRAVSTTSAFYRDPTLCRSRHSCTSRYRRAPVSSR